MSGQAHFLALLRRSCQPVEGHRQLVHVSRGDQKPRYTLLDQLRHSRYPGGHDGAAGRHRFHEDHRDAFGKARQAEHVGLCVVAAYVVLTDCSFQRDPVRYAEVLGATPKPFPERPVSDQDEPRLDPRSMITFIALNKTSSPLAGGEPGDAEHHEAGAFSWRRQAIAAQVGARVDHAQLCPVLGLGQVHQLRPGEITYAYDEICLLHFAGQVEALH